MNVPNQKVLAKHAASDEVAAIRRAARRRWPHLSPSAFEKLTSLVREYRFSVSAGDLIWIDRGWYVTHSGLLALATRQGCTGIEVHPVSEFCDARADRWVFAATVYPTRQSKGFSGYGDADPRNTTDTVRGAEMRVAETRAVNRALRKAYGVGLCSVEELGSMMPPDNGRAITITAQPRPGTLEVVGATPLREQLRRLIRQHGLDPTQTKNYALAHLGVASLREATREQVDSLLSHLQKRLFEDRDAFVDDLRRTTETREVA